MNLSKYERISVDVSGRQLVIKPGEMLLPIVVLISGGIYYVGTRGLPAQSMVYSGPLLYATMTLAIITLVQFSFSFDGESQSVEEYREAHERNGTTSDTEDLIEQTEDRESTSGNQFFNRYTAAGLTVVTTGYIIALSTISFIVPTIAFLAILLVLFGERRPIYVGVYSVGFTLLVWATFVYWLNIPL